MINDNAQILEFEGKANVILRAITDFEVNDIKYKKNDILLMLNEVDLEITYNEIVKDKTVGGRNLMAFDWRKLNAIRISENPVDMSFISLFAEKKKMNDKPFSMTWTETIEITNYTFYPLKPIIGEAVFIKDFGEAIVEYVEDDYGYGTATLSMNVDNELPDGEYVIVYETPIKELYNINNNYSLPYFRMDITAIGNIDKKEGGIYISIPKVSLLSRPDYSLNNKITAQSLDFKIIDDEILMGIY